MGDEARREAQRRAAAWGDPASAAVAEGCDRRYGTRVVCMWCTTPHAPDKSCCARRRLAHAVISGEVLDAAHERAAFDLAVDALAQSLTASRTPRSSRHAAVEQAQAEGARGLYVTSAGSDYFGGENGARHLARYLVDDLAQTTSMGTARYRVPIAAVLRVCQAAESPAELEPCGETSSDGHLACDMDEGHDGECEFA